MCIDGGPHDLVEGEIATPDGGRIPYLYCSKCNANFS